MGRIWSDDNKFRMWLKVEVAASLTLAEAGLVPREAAAAIRDRGGFDVARIHAIEAEVKHDVIAFTTAVAEKVGPQARWLHFGLTSNDVVDTAQALQIKAASEIIAGDLEQLAEVLKRRAHEFRHTPMIGRTHGIHAEPITFGLKLANWDSEKQKGSSAMPHKRNPVTCEQISGLARVVRANAQAALENVALWHERDISHSSVERVILPDSTILVDYLLAKTTNLIDRLLVYPARMKRNLESTGGLIFSGQLLLDLAESGMQREEAYRLVQRNAMRAWQEDKNFRELIGKEKEIARRMSRKQLERSFDLQRQLRNVDKIFGRVFGPDPPQRHRGTEKSSKEKKSWRKK